MAEKEGGEIDIKIDRYIEREVDTYTDGEIKLNLYPSPATGRYIDHIPALTKKFEIK